MLFPPGRPSRVKIAGIVGTGRAAIVAKMLVHLLTAAGSHVGHAAQGRIYSGGRQTDDRVLPLPAAVRRVLLDPDVEVAVLEIAPDDVVRYGLGCEILDVVAVVNAGSSAPTDDGHQSSPEQRLESVSAVVRAARHVVKVGESTELAKALYESIRALGLGTRLNAPSTQL
jgi:cyanophycin synthetase